MERDDEKVVPLIARINNRRPAAFFEEIGGKFVFAPSSSQVGEVSVAVSLRGKLREILLHWEITSKEVVEFGRRDASLDDIFI